MTRCRAKAFAAMVALFGAALGASAVACMCGNPDAAALEASASKFEQVYAGLIIWTEQIPADPYPPPSDPEMPALDPGYWIKSKVLVLRVWRGTPPMVAEVWTRVAIDCDMAPIPGLYFVALANREAGRSVADFSMCHSTLREYATKGSARFETAGMATLGTALGLEVVAFVWLVRFVRRGRSSAAKV